jgi:hypothetical protein
MTMLRLHGGEIWQTMDAKRSRMASGYAIGVGGSGSCTEINMAQSSCHNAIETSITITSGSS